MSQSIEIKAAPSPAAVKQDFALRQLGFRPFYLLASVFAALWSAAFALYAVRYWPILTRARLDGKPG